MSLVRKLLFYTSNIVTIIAPIALLFLPVDFFDEGEKAFVYQYNWLE